MKTSRWMGILFLALLIGNFSGVFGESPRSIIIYSAIFSLVITVVGIYIFLQALHLRRFRWYYILLGVIMAISQPYFIAGLFIRTRLGIEIVPDVFGSMIIIIYVIGIISLMMLPQFQKNTL